MCNCDRNDNVERRDEGYLTDKNVLPVSSVHVGDTGMLDLFSVERARVWW